MYEIQKLNRADTVLVSNALYPVVIDLEHAWYMLEELENMFGPVPHALRDDEAERLWHTICVAKSIVYDALPHFYLTTGDKEWPGVKSFIRSAEIVLGKEVKQ